MTGQKIETAPHNSTELPARHPIGFTLLSIIVGTMAVLAMVASVQASHGSRLPIVAGAPHTSEQASAANLNPAGANGEDDDGEDDDGEDGDGEDNDRAEVKGTLAAPATAFVGEWVLNVDSNRSVTVLMTASSDVLKFRNHLPSVGDWIEAKGVWIGPDRMEARRVRPDKYEANQIIARLKPGVSPETLAATYEMTVTGVLESANIFLFHTYDDEDLKIQRLLNDKANVEWAEVNWTSRVPTGTPYRSWRWGEASSYENQHAFDLVNLGPALAHYDGSGVVVAVLDTGVELGHTALQASLIGGRDMISDTATPNDIGPGLAWGHGTHVAGIVHRMAPKSKILPIRVLDSQGRGNTFVLAYAIEYAVQQGADVINLSLGADCGSQVLHSAIQRAIGEGVVIVAAAGNSNTEVPQCPASMPGVIAVAAVDENKVRAEWSNYGDRWVDIAAPGVGITSTFPGGYASWSGTSMATPFVSGAAALAKQKQEISNSNMPVDRMLIECGADIDAINTEAIGPLLDVAAAVAAWPTETESTLRPLYGAHNLFLPAIANPSFDSQRC